MNRLEDISIYEDEFFLLKELTEEERECMANYVHSDTDYKMEYLLSLDDNKLKKYYSDAVHDYNRDMNGI